MRQSRLIIPALAALLLPGLLFSLLFYRWLAYDATRSWTVFEPGMDKQPPGRKGSPLVKAVFGSFSAMFDARPEAQLLEGSWPSFRGEGRNNSQKPGSFGETLTSLSQARLLWQAALGEGHGGPAVKNGRVYLSDYDESAGRDIVRCFRLSDGVELWQTGYAHPLKRNHGFSRAIPAVTETSVISFGPEGHVMALDRESGALLWGIDLAAEWGAKIPSWYTAQCPLVDGGVVVLAPASEKAFMIGVDEHSGELLWQAPPVSGRTLSHSSVMKAQISGKSQYIYSAVGGITGVSAEEGKILWKHPWNANVVAPSPVVWNNRVIQSAGYGAGSVIIEISFEGGVWQTAEIAKYAPSKGLSSEQQTPILCGDFLIGIQPKDAGSLREQLVAADASGQILWASGAQLRLGLGPYILCGDRLLALNDDAELFLLRVSRESWELLDRRVIIDDAADAWGPLALTETGILLARDATRLVCYDLNGGER